jgi:hypothetical protein
MRTFSRRAFVGRVVEVHLSQQPEEVVKELLAHKVPGVLVVPSAAARVAIAAKCGSL